MTLADARQAFFDGDFERCLVLCDAVRTPNNPMRFEVAVLRARVHLRLDRGDRALEALRAVEFTALTVDQYVTAQMLIGAAYVRVGQKLHGEAILGEAEAMAADAHPTVRAELLLQLAIAKFRLGSYDEADRLLAAVGADQDVVHAHATEYRGWVAQARGDFAAAAGWFRAALSALTTSRRRDRYVEAKSLYGLAALAPELLLTEDWPSVESRVRAFDWSASGLTTWRFWVSIAASMMSETIGDEAGACRWARHAEQTAEAAGYRVVALCRLAAVFRGLRERNAHAEFVERARELYDSIDVRHLGADLQQLPLYLGEEAAHSSELSAADALLAQYRTVIRPALKSSSGESDRYDAMEHSVEALLFDSRGDNAKAVRAFSDAFHVLARLGYRRRAAAVALRLARLTGKSRYVTYVEESLRGASPRFWMSRDLRELVSGDGPSVTETEMKILRLLVQGKTYKEIAGERRASAKTVGHHVQSLFRKFGVNSRGELTATALQRGVVSMHHDARGRSA
ncbi:MAG TPA: helix-turn-helix transcriptional regulator [Candidatus Elarobacter sp.]